MSQERLPEMGFWDHIDALRGVLLRIAGVVIVLAAAFFVAMPWIFDNVILAPCRQDFILYRIFASITSLSSLLPDFYTDDGFEVRLINIKLASQFFTHISTSFWLAFVAAFPIILWQLWRFVAPGLYDREKRGVGRAFIMGIAMFYLGVSVGYFLVFPLTLRFLAEYHVSLMVPNQISLDSYMDNFLVLIFVMGMVFELPMLAWLLGKLGLLSRRLLSKYRRHAVVVLLILAALITPTGDPFTLMVVFLPVYLLWEMSALLLPRDTKDENLEQNNDIQ